MFSKSISDVPTIDWGNGTSHRLLTAADGVGFAIAHTVVRAGSESKLEYRNHIEACYCISGSGEVEDLHGRTETITPGVLYVLDAHDKHYLRAAPHEDLVLVSVFNPAITGTERHVLTTSGFSSY